MPAVSFPKVIQDTMMLSEILGQKTIGDMARRVFAQMRTAIISRIWEYAACDYCI
jgi:hypothetical protein